MSRTPEQARLLEPSSAEADAGQLVGRDPRRVQAEDLVAAGFITSPTKAIRAKCLDCSGENAAEVRKCVAVTCALWPFRMGKNVFFGKLKDTVEDTEEGGE